MGDILAQAIHLFPSLAPKGAFSQGGAGTVLRNMGERAHEIPPGGERSLVIKGKTLIGRMTIRADPKGLLISKYGRGCSEMRETGCCGPESKGRGWIRMGWSR